jgi:hypothetical protein
MEIESILIVLVCLWLFGSVFIWFWNAYLEQFVRIMLPPRDKDEDGRKEEAFNAMRKAFGRKKE